MGLLTISELSGLGFSWNPFTWRGESAGERASRLERERLHAESNARLLRAVARARSAQRIRHRKALRAAKARYRQHSPRTVKEREFARHFRDAYQQAPKRGEYPSAAYPYGSRVYAVTGSRMGMQTRSGVRAPRRAVVARRPAPRPRTQVARAPAPPRPVTTSYRTPTVTRGLVRGGGPSLGPVVSYASR